MKSWMKKYGWRGLCPIGALPILLLAFIWLKAPESSVWLAARQRQQNVALLPVYAYLILLMACFNFFSHGTQDLYPTFFKVQHGPEPHIISLMAICYSNAAMPRGGFLPGAVGGSWPKKRLSQPLLRWRYCRYGRSPAVPAPSVSARL